MYKAFEVAPANIKFHKNLYERLQQLRDRKTPDDYLQLEAADIIAECQKPLLDIIDALQNEIKKVCPEYLDF